MCVIQMTLIDNHHSLHLPISTSPRTCHVREQAVPDLYYSSILQFSDLSHSAHCIYPRDKTKDTSNAEHINLK